MYYTEKYIILWALYSTTDGEFAGKGQYFEQKRFPLSSPLTGGNLWKEYNNFKKKGED